MKPLSLKPEDLAGKIPRFWATSAGKIDLIEKNFDRSLGSPVFTSDGRYTARGWTEWTEGFLYGSALLQFDATGVQRYLDLGRERIVARMPRHVSHIGVHDHGFKNVSTFGNLLRIMREGGIAHDPWEARYYELALMVSGAVQAARWSMTSLGSGYIYSFNGPHSLFADTIRSLRSLAVAYLLGHRLMGEGDRRISLLDRLVQHAATTARYIVYYGRGPIQQVRTRGFERCGDCGPGDDAPGALFDSRGFGRRRELFRCGPHDPEYPSRRALPESRRLTSGVASPFCLPSSERLGSCPEGKGNSMRRVQHVGRLSPSRSSAVSGPSPIGETLFPFLSGRASQ